MPYDEDGNLIPEEDDPEGTAAESQSPNFNADIGEYIRRMQAQNQMASAGNGASVATMPSSYSPPTIGPAETRYRQTQAQTPLKQNFHPSGIRKVLGMLAGGASGSPDVRDNIINSQYNHAQGDFQQKLGVQEAAAKEEEAATQRSAVQAHLGAQSAAEVERAKTMQANARAAGALRDYRVYLTTDLAHKRKMEELGVQRGSANKPEYHEAILTSGEKVNLLRTPEGRLKNVDTGEVISTSAIKQMSDPGKTIKTSSPYSGALKEDMEAHQVISEENANPGTHSPFEVDAAKLYIEARKRNQQPNDAFNEVVRAMESEGKGKGKDGKLTSDQMIQLRNMMPEQRLPQAPPMVDPSSNKLFQPKVGDVMPPGSTTTQQFGTENMGTATTRTMKETAPKVIALADKVLAQVKQQKDNLGPGASRWNEFWAGKVGAPNPEFTQLRTNTALLQTLLMRMHVGAAGRVAMMQHFQDLFDVGKQSPENMEAAVGEIKDYAQEIGGLKPQAPGTPTNTNLPKIGETFEGSKVKSIKQIK
jgi:hypothetical protein